VEEFKTWGPLFQSTLLQEERLLGCLKIFITLWFQSTLLQEERLSNVPSAYLLLNFNPRSYKRSDSYYYNVPVKWIDFNPRSYKRSDPCTSSLCSGMLLFQSTLLQEERPLRYDPGLILPDFNPRSYKRSDSQSMLSMSCHQ